MFLCALLVCSFLVQLLHHICSSHFIDTLHRGYCPSSQFITYAFVVQQVLIWSCNHCLTECLAFIAWLGLIGNCWEKFFASTSVASSDQWCWSTFRQNIINETALVVQFCRAWFSQQPDWVLSHRDHYAVLGGVVLEELKPDLSHELTSFSTLALLVVLSGL